MAGGAVQLFLKCPELESDHQRHAAGKKKAAKTDPLLLIKSDRKNKHGKADRAEDCQANRIALFDRAILFQVHRENFAEPFQFFRRILVRSFQTVPFSFVPVIGQLSRPTMKTDASSETPETAREGVCAPLKQPSLFSARWLHPQFFVTQFRGDAALRGSV
jgi:hypothetical protein